MEEKERKVVNTNLGILLICLFSSLFTLIDYIVIDRALDKYVDCSKCTKCEVKESGTISGNTDNTPVVEDKKTDDAEKKYDNFKNFSCIEKNENYCLFKNDDNLKVEIEASSDLNYTVIINDNRFFPDLNYSSYLDDIQVLDDGYVYVQYGIQGMGPVEKAFILDSNANVISKTVDIDYIIDGKDHADIRFEDNKLSLTNVIFGDGGLGVICMSDKKPSDDATVYVYYQYEYIGNGKISEVSHMSKSFSEYLQAYTGYSTCEDYLNR